MARNFRNVKHYPMRPLTYVRRMLNGAPVVPAMDDQQKLEMYEGLISTRCGSPALLARLQAEVESLRTRLAGQL